MKSILVSILLIIFSLYLIIPFPPALGWWEDLLLILRGFLPLMLALIACIMFISGLANIKDRKAAQKEAEELENKEK